MFNVDFHCHLSLTEFYFFSIFICILLLKSVVDNFYSLSLMYCSLTCFSAKFCQFLVTCSKVYDSNLGVRNYEAPCRTDGIFCRTVCLMLFFCSCYSNVAMNEFSIAMSLTNIIFVLFAHFLGLLHARHHSPAETSFGIFGAELFYTTLPTLQMLRFASVLSIPS